MSIYLYKFFPPCALTLKFSCTVVVLRKKHAIERRVMLSIFVFGYYTYSTVY